MADSPRGCCGEAAWDGAQAQPQGPESSLASQPCSLGDFGPQSQEAREGCLGNVLLVPSSATRLLSVGVADATRCSNVQGRLMCRPAHRTHVHNTHPSHTPHTCTHPTHVHAIYTPTHVVCVALCTCTPTYTYTPDTCAAHTSRTTHTRSGLLSHGDMGVAGRAPVRKE